MMKDDMTLDQWFERWMSTYKKNISPVTKAGYRVAYNHVSDALGYRKLDTLVNSNFYDLFNDMVEFGHSSFTIRQTKMVIRQCLEAALNNELIIQNPVPAKYIANAMNVKNSVLSIEEQKRLIRFMYENKYPYLELVLLMLMTGLRSGEIRSLTWENVFLEEGYLHVNRNLREYYVDGERRVEVNNPKTKKSRRRVYLSDDGISVLKQYEKNDIDINQETVQTFGNLLFPYKGKVMLQSDIYYIFSCLCDDMNKNGYEIRKLTAHMMRHTYCTRCFESGVNVKVIAQQMGHASINTTLNIYTDPDISALATEMKKLELHLKNQD